MVILRVVAKDELGTVVHNDFVLHIKVQWLGAITCHVIRGSIKGFMFRLDVYV